MSHSNMKQYIILAVSCFVSSVTTAAALYIAGTIYILQPFKKQAVEMGAADWVVTDTATGTTEFQWNELVAEVYGDMPLEQNEKALGSINTGKNL